MPASFWVDVVQTTVFVENRSLRLIYKALPLLKNCFVILLTTIFQKFLFVLVIPISLPHLLTN